MAVERGSLVIADISGYTSYLTGVELEHSHDVLADLLDTIAREASANLTMSKLEGDAIFWYRVGEPDPAVVFPTLEACYAAFRRRLRTIEYDTTCTCNACRQIPRLDLKVLAHLGEFVVREIAGVRELVGTDVIVVHRLLKNGVQERFGLRAYAMLTAPFAAAVDIEPSEQWREHIERYEDVGEVHTLVCDLATRWKAGEERSPVIVPAGGRYSVEFDLPAPPAVVWEWMTSPRLRARWEAGTSKVVQTNPDGVPGVGSRNHCMHGRSSNDEEVLDWRPFHYTTISSRQSGTTFLFTAELSEVQSGGTHLSWRVAPSPSRRNRVMLPMIWPIMRRFMRKGLAVLEPLLAQASRAEEGRASAAAG